MRLYLLFFSVFTIIYTGCSFPRTYDFTNDQEMWGGFLKDSKYKLERNVFITRKNNYWAMSPSINMYNNVRIYPDSSNINEKLQRFDRELYDNVGILKSNTIIILIGLEGNYIPDVGKMLRFEAQIIDGEYAGRIVKFDRMCTRTGKKVKGFYPLKPNEYYMKEIKGRKLIESTPS